MRRNFNGVGDVISELRQELREKAMNLKEFGFKSLADDLRDNWDAVLEIMKESKLTSPSKYSLLVERLALRGYKVSESTLRTTVMRIKRDKLKSAKKIRKVVPPSVEAVEEIETTPHQVTEAESTPNVLEDLVEPPVDSQSTLVNEPAIYASYIETGSIADEFEVNDDSVCNFDWETEIIRLLKRDGHISRAWSGWDKRLFNVLLWIAIKNRCTIRMVSSNDQDFFFDYKKTECFNLFVEKADQHQQDINIPKEFAS